MSIFVQEHEKDDIHVAKLESWLIPLFVNWGLDTDSFGCTILLSFVY